MKSLALIVGFLAMVVACKQTEQEPQQEETFPIVKVATRLGDMFFWMYDETPNHKAKFIELAEAKHYNQFTFNRVVKDFVVQGGCPDSAEYFVNSPYLIEPEFVDSIGHEYGALGIGRDNNPKKLSNVCQFYVVCKEEGLPNLDGEYMIFGKIIDGKEVLEIIEAEQTDGRNKPLEPIPLDVSIQQFTAKQVFEQFGFQIQH